MKRFPRRHAQASETFLPMALLSVSGGLQDAYTYFARGGVFANAQTGNIVLLSQNLFVGNWLHGVRYLVPVLAFAIGVAAAEQLRTRCQRMNRINWQQTILLVEVACLCLVSIIPRPLDLLANSMVSFSCAMQVQAFRKIDGYTFASTMCIGNLRSGVESLSSYFQNRDCQALKKSIRYFAVIFLFGLGAGLGSVFLPVLGQGTILLSCGLLLGSFILMF